MTSARVTFRLDGDLFDRVEELAETDCFDSRSDVLRAALREFDPKPRGSDGEIVVAGDDAEIIADGGVSAIETPRATGLDEFASEVARVEWAATADEMEVHYGSTERNGMNAELVLHYRGDRR